MMMQPVSSCTLMVTVMGWGYYTLEETHPFTPDELLLWRSENREKKREQQINKKKEMERLASLERLRQQIAEQERLRQRESLQ